MLVLAASVSDLSSHKLSFSLLPLQLNAALHHFLQTAAFKMDPKSNLLVCRAAHVASPSRVVAAPPDYITHGKVKQDDVSSGARCRRALNGPLEPRLQLLPQQTSSRLLPRAPLQRVPACSRRWWAENKGVTQQSLAGVNVTNMTFPAWDFIRLGIVCVQPRLVCVCVLFCLLCFGTKRDSHYGAFKEEGLQMQ